MVFVQGTFESGLCQITADIRIVAVQFGAGARRTVTPMAQGSSRSPRSPYLLAATLDSVARRPSQNSPSGLTSTLVVVRPAASSPTVRIRWSRKQTEPSSSVVTRLGVLMFGLLN